MDSSDACAEEHIVTEHVPEEVVVDSSPGHRWEAEYQAVRSAVRGGCYDSRMLARALAHDQPEYIVPCVGRSRVARGSRVCDNSRRFQHRLALGKWVEVATAVAEAGRHEDARR